MLTSVTNFLDLQYDTKYRFDKMGHTYAVEVDSDDISVCTERLVEFFRDIDSKDVPVIDDSASTYTTVHDRLLETAK